MESAPPDQISSKSVLKSNDKTPKDKLLLVLVVAFFLPDSKSPISFKMLAAPLVSFLIAASPTVAVYIAFTSAAVLSTAFKLLSSNRISNVFASSRAFSVSRNSVNLELQKQRRYVSFALAQNWSMHVL